MSRRPHTLVIDDEPFIRQAICDTLERDDHVLKTAENGLDAEDVLETFTPDIVICDLIMPKKDGFETIADIRAKNSDVRIIAISGGERTSSNKSFNDAIRLGADLLLAKPFGARDILEAVRELLATPRG